MQELTAVMHVEQMLLSRGTADHAFAVSLPLLSLKAGEVVAITGPSGCGKSTLIEGLGLILRPQTVGCYRLLDQDLTEAVRHPQRVSEQKLAHLRSRALGFVPQSGGLLPYLTVDQNIALQARIQCQQPDVAWLSEAVARLGLTGLGSRFPRELSMGQRQRVSFLRALAHRPAVLLADEPTAALDPHHARHLFEVMLDMVRDVGVAAVVVTHEWDLVAALSLDRLQARSVSATQMEFVRS